MNARGDEHWAVVEELQQQVRDLTQQVSALQRQLQMQGEVSRLAASLKDRLDEFASECERRVARLDGRISAVEARVAEAERMLLAERIDLKSNQPLNGIISHLRRECGGNVHMEGVVNVTASSCYGEGCKPENAVDFNPNRPFASQDLPNSWICYDFKGRRVTPTSYSIMSWAAVPGYNHLKSWVLEVSNDGSEGSWETVDSRENNNNLNRENGTCNFPIIDPPSGAFRFVRLRLTGPTHKGDHMLEFCALELFGVLSLA